MNPNFLFAAFNIIAFLCWLPLFFFPYHPATQKYVQNFWTPIFFAIVYIFCFTNIIVSSNLFMNLNSIEDVKTFFDGPWGFLTGWVHYLCFDFVVGSYIVIGARKIHLKKVLVITCLVFTFLLGPLGFLLYRGFKITKSRS
jgi:hypothetical protein